MKIYSIIGLGSFSANCYIIETERKNAVLIDAPCASDYILKQLESKELALSAILLTHCHLDHISATAEIAEKTGCKVYIHKNDLNGLTDDYQNLADFFGLSGTVPHYSDAVALTDGEKLVFDELEITVMLTEGHSNGSVCYLCDNVMFTGDTLFEGSVGRTDMPNGNSVKLVNSLKMLSKLDRDYIVLSGHGSATTLAEEKASNPYLTGGFYDFDF